MLFTCSSSESFELKTVLDFVRVDYVGLQTRFEIE